MCTLKRSVKSDENLIEKWWTAVELWYNFSDRYDIAMDVWIEAVQEYVFLDKEGRKNDVSDFVGYEYGIDNLEIEWKKILLQLESTHALASNGNDEMNATDDLPREPDEWSISVIRLLIFVAGMCLDASNVATARQCLFHSILLLVSEIVARKWIVHNAASGRTSSPFVESPLREDDETSSTNCLFQLLASALQEYITSYEEDQEIIAHWLVARRIAALRLSLLASSDVETPQRCFWNPANVYQRPPYYIHYPYFLRNSVDCEVSQELSLSVLPRHSHPLWCHQLEQHTHIIQKEFEELLLQNAASSSSTKSQYVNDDHYKSCSTTSSVPTHWPKVGAGTHRNGAGMHDSSVVRNGGDWREIVLFSANFTPNDTESVSIAPLTKRLIQQYCSDEVLSLVDSGIGEVIFSVLAPHTHILPHTASHNVRYTAHLPLRIPKLRSSDTNPSKDDPEKPACFIRVGADVCHWHVGQMLVFDDSYEHEVVNSTDEIRGILLIRFWHPLLSICKDRETAIQWVQKEQNEDRCKRFNPPLPPQLFSESNGKKHKVAVMARGMEQACCPSCKSTGYSSLRCNLQKRQFVCGCGAVI